jgi:uncharacterized lipoprotein YehR (DUF1307 family)
MKTLLISIALIEMLILGFYLGQTHHLKKQIQKQDSCITYVLKKDINLKEFYDEKIEFKSIFIHAQAAVALKYQNCMWSDK